MAPAALPVQVEKERKGLRRRATVGDLGPSTSLALPSALPDLLPTLQGTLHKRHRTSRVREWGARLSFQRVRPSNRPLAIQPFSPPSLLPGKRHFRVDDLAGMLCYFRTELQLLKNEPVLKLRLGNLASVRPAPFLAQRRRPSRALNAPALLPSRPQVRALEFPLNAFELRFYGEKAAQDSAGRSCGRAAAAELEQEKALVASLPPSLRHLAAQAAAADEAEGNEYEDTCKRAPRCMLLRADTEDELQLWVSGLQARCPSSPPAVPRRGTPPAPLPPFLLQPCQHLPRPSRPPGAHRQAMGRRAAATTRRRRRVRRARPRSLRGLPRPRRRRLDRRPPRDVRHAARSPGAGRRCRRCRCAAAAAAKARLRACRCAAPRSPPDQRSPPAHHAASCAAR